MPILAIVEWISYDLTRVVGPAIRFAMRPSCFYDLHELPLRICLHPKQHAGRRSVENVDNKPLHLQS